jgi:hypothetical protein
MIFVVGITHENLVSLLFGDLAPSNMWEGLRFGVFRVLQGLEVEAQDLRFLVIERVSG